MAFVHLYTHPFSLFDDRFAAQCFPRTCTPSAKAGHETSRSHGIYRPRLDLHESNDSNTVSATLELPGLTSQDVTIDVHQNQLTVSGEFFAPDAAEGRNFVVRERRSGKFSRTLRLPFGTKPDDVNAKMENGILTITFPKTSPEQQAKRVPIQ